MITFSGFLLLKKHCPEAAVDLMMAWPEAAAVLVLAWLEAAAYLMVA